MKTKNIKNSTEIINKLYSYHRFGIKPGLDRVFYILAKLDNPQKHIKTIHIAGTNGKGSTASIIASILMEAGYKVGIYTSPHILHFKERFKINGKFINDEKLVNLINQIMPIGEEINATFFEITTAIAFKYFYDEKVDIAIIEAGMGGKNDATNIITPLMSIFTKIDIDHIEYLGNTINKITKDKSGIIKPNINVIIQKNTKKVTNIIEKKALELNSKVFYSSNIDLKFKSINDEFQMSLNLKLDDNKYSLLIELPGKHQIENIKTAITAINLLPKGFNINSKNIIDGILNIKENTNHRGRIDLIKSNPYLIIDVSHNADSIKKLVETILLIKKKHSWNFIFGAMSDKDINLMLMQIKRISSNITITKPNIQRAEETDAIYKLAKELDFENIQVCKNVQEAILHHDFRKNTIIAGSFYLIEEVVTSLNLKNFFNENNQ